MKVVVSLVLLFWLAGVASGQSGAFSYGVYSGGAAAACNDTIDNDSDGIADYPGDAGCSAPSDTGESGDVLVTVIGSLSAADLQTCVGGSDAPANCNNHGGTAAATTVCSATTTGDTNGTCDSTTYRNVTTNLDTATAGVAYNYLEFDGRLYIDVSDTRLVNVRQVNYQTTTQANELYNAHNLVVHSSVFNGVSRGDGTCYMPQAFWFYESENVRITNNTIEDYCIGNCGNETCWHTEAFWVAFDTEDLLIMGNTFQDNGGTAQIHMSFCGSGCTAAQHSRQICIHQNTIGPRTAGTSTDLNIHNNGPVGTGTELWIAIDEPEADINFNPPVETNDFFTTCRQCLDGIDNDSDGLVDWWDPDCAADAGTDNNESL